MNTLYLRTHTKARSSTVLMAAIACCAFMWWACEGVKLAQETESGGIVTYPFKEKGHLVSPFRNEAFRLIEKRCHGASRIVREGEAKGRSRINENAGGAEVIHERRWGIQFECR